MLVIGGTISKVTGGKFANGATTAAFAQAFNGETAIEELKQNQKIALLKIKGLLEVNYSEKDGIIAGVGDKFSLEFKEGNVLAKIKQGKRYVAFGQDLNKEITEIALAAGIGEMNLAISPKTNQIMFNAKINIPGFLGYGGTSVTVYSADVINSTHVGKSLYDYGSYTGENSRFCKDLKASGGSC